jgi:D-citramalate synthase
VVPEDLPYIIADVLKRPHHQQLRVESWRVFVSDGEIPHAEVSVSYRDQIEKGEASGDGGYDAFMNALKKAVKSFDIAVPRLEDFRVRIPPGGRTFALVETMITWRRDGAAARPRRTRDESFSTIGVDSDQMASAVIATEKMLNALLDQGSGTRNSRRGTRRGARKSRS